MAGYHEPSAGSGCLKPSGTFECLCDRYFTLTAGTDHFYAYLGYDRQTFQDVHHNRVFDVIYEEDRTWVMNEIERQLARASVFMIENRIVTQSGKLRWIRVCAEMRQDSQRGSWLYCIFFDISDKKQAEIQMAVKEQRYEIVHAYTQNIIFELDLNTMKFYHSPEFEKKFGYTIPSEGFPDSLFTADIIFKHDKPRLLKQFKQLLSSRDSIEHECRLKTRGGAYIWVKIYAKYFCGVPEKASRILGLIEDINDQKQELLEIQRTSTLDPLTGLCNRGECIRQIEEYIRHNRSMAAFLMLDLDNFKMINDTMGHAYGDKLLQEISAKLRSMIRQSDVLARLGGDEFVIFMTHINGKEDALKKIDHIFSLFQQINVEKTAVSVSCSIGCSLYPTDGDTFYQLYQKADAAMYHVKKHGRSQYAVFEEGTISGFRKDKTVLPAGSMQKTFHDQILEQVFRIFQENPENDKAIPRLLELIGGIFHADRIYICEKSDDNTFIITFQWSAPDMVSLHDSLADYPSPHSWEEHRKDAVVTIEDTSKVDDGDLRNWFEKRGVLSAAVCFLHEKEELLTAVIFEDCHGIRQKNEEEKYTLFLISQIVDLFINKERVQKEAGERIHFLIDCIAGGMTGRYLEEGFPLYFMNQRMLELLGYQSQEEYAKAVNGLIINSILPEDREQVQTDMLRQLEAHNEYETEFRMLKKDGTYIWVNEKGKRTTTVSGRQAVICLGVDISTQKDYENQLDLYRKTASGAFITLTDEDFTLLYGNDIFYSMFEITKEEMARRGFCGSSLIDPDELPSLRERFDAAIQRHSVDFQVETRVVTGLGNIKWFLINGTFEYQNERPVLNGFVIDLSENHLLKQEILHRELVYRTALNQTPFKVWEYDIQHHTLLLSDQMKEEYLFMSRVEGMPDALMEKRLVHPGSRHDLYTLYRQLDEGKPHVQADILSRYHSEGPWTWQRVQYTTLYDAEGKPSSAVAVAEDITRQKEAEIQYQQDLQLRMAFHDGLIGSFRCNLDTNLIEYAEGPTLEQFSPGMCYEELMEFHNRSMANQEDALRLKTLMNRNALIKAFHEGRHTLSFEYRRRDSTGKLFWVCASIHLVQDIRNGDLYAYGTLQDINDKKVLELTMKNRAEHDMLTGAYNKDTAIQLISDYLLKNHRQQNSCALLLFHVDHFARIVRECGYEIADSILKESAGQLMGSGGDKIVGKFYGEEFIVFIYNNPRLEQVKRYAEQARKAISLPYMFPNAQYPVSLSAGIVFDNSLNATFDSLYHKARLALAASKTSDSGGIFIYSDRLEHRTVPREPAPAAEFRLTPQSYSDSSVNLLIRCMYSLTSSQDFKQSLENILKELGAYYQSDRVYVIEMEHKKQRIHNIYEWHSDDVVSIHNGGVMPLDPKQVYDALVEHFQGLCYETNLGQKQDLHPRGRDILEKLHIHSHFIATLSDGKHPVGYIGINNPEANIDDLSVLNALRYILANELTKYRLQEKQMFLSYHDELTGLLNRNRLKVYQEELGEEGLISMGVVSLDINGLKQINRKHGSTYGDDLICYMAKIMAEVFPYWEIYRLAGDEFLIICENISSDAFNQKSAELKRQLTKICGVSIGSAWNDVDINLDALINSADEKRIISKQNYYHEIGGGSKRYHEQIRKNLLHSLKQHCFSIYLQPKIDSRTGEVYGAEALIRYYDPAAGLIPPGKFVPYLEHVGLIHYIDFFVLQQVCITLQKWNGSGLKPIPISLNFSRSTLLEENLIDHMEEVISQWNIDRSYLEIEITESLGEVESDAITRIGRQIEQAGLRIALDDFGAKYSNISFLSVLNFNHLKLDKGLVNNLMINENARVIVKNIMNLCRELHVNVIAEGVESQEQLEILKELHCYYIQGYYYDKPMTVSAFEERYPLKKE